MSKAYIEGIREYCPNVLIVHDKFHVVQDFNKVMDRIIDEFKKADEEYKGFFKKTKWLLVMNPMRLKEEGEIRLRQLLNINMSLIRGSPTGYIRSPPMVGQASRLS